MFEWIFTAEGWIALLTLSTLEIVLGVDNLVFISIVVSRLPASQRSRAARRVASSSSFAVDASPVVRVIRRYSFVGGRVR